MKVAIIGAGISGLTTAWLLHNKHEITLFEKNSYVGGHTHTVDVQVQGNTYAVDTGFIVFNDRTYPNFKALLRKLKVAWQDTEMSFSVRDSHSGLEYNGHNLNRLFAQRKNLLSPKFYRLLTGILEFNKQAQHAAMHEQNLDQITLGQFLEKHTIPKPVSDYYLLPMVAAIWSTSIVDAKSFPLGFFLRFFSNHGLLNVANRPQWHTVVGGSSRYIKPLTESFSDRIRCNADIRKVHRYLEGREGPVVLEMSDGSKQDFDEVIFACHSDEALELLANPSAKEQAILAGIPYLKNHVVLHTDVRLLPRNKRAWASWNYFIRAGETEVKQASSVTYNMNILQQIQAPETFCVSLNNSAAIDPELILGEYQYAHPVYTAESMQARARRDEISGSDHTHYVGAYWYNGFHEDGVCSAIDVATGLGATWNVN